jgi:hypothetical protein
MNKSYRYEVLAPKIIYMHDIYINLVEINKLLINLDCEEEWYRHDNKSMGKSTLIHAESKNINHIQMTNQKI